MPNPIQMTTDNSQVSASVKAVQLVRSLFEAIHGNIGLLKFNIDELEPLNGKNGKESKIWKVVCTFYETLGSTSPSKYEARVNLEDNSIELKKLFGENIPGAKDIQGRWTKKDES